MKKTPSLFKREFEGHHITRCLPIIEIINGADILLEGIPTIKYDGACCMIKDGLLYKRYDAKKGKQAPEGAIPCQPEADPITGHWPHWITVDVNNPADQWFIEAFNNTQPTSLIETTSVNNETISYQQFRRRELSDGTYEAVGPHFQGNPYNLDKDYLYKHGTVIITDLIRTFDGVKQWLEQHNEEGIVFWLNGEPRAKIKRSDFGLKWNQRK